MINSGGFAVLGEAMHTPEEIEADIKADIAADIAADVAEIDTPRVVSRPDSSARIFVTALVHEVNDREEKVTIIRFDAMVPLSKSSQPVTAENLRTGVQQSAAIPRLV